MEGPNFGAENNPADFSEVLEGRKHDGTHQRAPLTQDRGHLLECGDHLRIGMQVTLMEMADEANPQAADSKMQLAAKIVPCGRYAAGILRVVSAAAVGADSGLKRGSNHAATRARQDDRALEAAPMPLRPLLVFALLAAFGLAAARAGEPDLSRDASPWPEERAHVRL